MVRVWMVLAVLLSMFRLVWADVALAQGIDILGQARQQVEGQVDEQEAAVQERLAKLEAMQGGKKARVLVLKWPDTELGEENVLLQEIVRNQIGRPGAKFYPSIDLYQEGRRRLYVNGVVASPLDQPGKVPASVVQSVRDRLSRLKGRLGSGFNDKGVAGELLELVDEVWFIDGPETRELLFDVYMALGQAVFQLDEQVPPYFRNVGVEHVNYYLYLAAAMLWEERRLLDVGDIGMDPLEPKLPATAIGRFVRDLVSAIDDGFYPTIPFAFHDHGLFDPQKFAREFKVLVNGLEVVVPHEGVIDVPRGRIHVSLERKDGFGLSERVEVQRLDDKMYFMIDVARGRMGYSLLWQLMNHSNVCSPDIDRETRATLATYAALHPKEEIYVAIPKAGSAYDVYVWMWDRHEGQLKLVLDKNRGFPIRFALLTGTGLFFNGASLSDEYVSGLSEQQPTDLTSPDASISALGANPFKLDPAGVPIDFQLRGHFNRFMFGVGVQFSVNVVPEDKGGTGAWTDRYQTGGHRVTDPTPELDPLTGDGAGEVFHEELWNRLIYGMAGVMLLNNASYGIGPRAYVRAGTMNLPHVVELSGHIGMTEDPSFGKKEPKGRVVGLIDVDLFAGMLVPYGDTVFVSSVPAVGRFNSTGYRSRIMPNIGFTLGGGLTF